MKFSIAIVALMAAVAYASPMANVTRTVVERANGCTPPKSKWSTQIHWQNKIINFGSSKPEDVITKALNSACQNNMCSQNDIDIPIMVNDNAGTGISAKITARITGQYALDCTVTNDDKATQEIHDTWIKIMAGAIGKTVQNKGVESCTPSGYYMSPPNCVKTGNSYAVSDLSIVRTDDEGADGGSMTISMTFHEDPSDIGCKIVASLIGAFLTTMGPVGGVAGKTFGTIAPKAC